MRPRFRSTSGPNAAREGRPLELVRVRGTQRDSGREGRPLGRRPRRRGGRGRGPRAPGGGGRFSLWDWLRGLFGGPERPRSATLAEQEARIIEGFSKHYGLRFKDPSLLKLALTHRSYLHVSGQGPRDSNERLEFLGDSVLGLVTSEYLYRAHPTEHEGQLTKTKSLLVSKAILSRRALAMGLGKFVLMSHSEVESGGRQRLSILADAFEAVVGAVYLDQGFEAAREFIERWLLRESRVIAADKRHTNYKSHLQEYVQGAFRTHPVYRIRSEMGPDHSKQFNVEVMVGKRVLGQGKGRNKKEAEQSAARDALERVEVAHAERARRREVREGRPGREDEAVAGPRHGRAMPAADQPMEEPSGVDETESEEGSAGRRRRGRRGGRGRRRPEGHDLETTASAGPATRPAPAPFMRPAPESPVERRERVTELEPLPPARHEDDLEEVGRPEGPLEERHVDPYAWTSPLESDARPDEEEAAAWPEPVSEDMDSESSAAETSDEPADSQEETRDESPSFRSAESDEEPTPERDDRGSSASQETREEEPVEGPTEGESGRGEPKQPPAPTWGRRVRRGPGR